MDNKLNETREKSQRLFRKRPYLFVAIIGLLAVLISLLLISVKIEYDRLSSIPSWTRTERMARNIEKVLEYYIFDTSDKKLCLGSGQSVDKVDDVLVSLQKTTLIKEEEYGPYLEPFYLNNQISPKRYYPANKYGDGIKGWKITVNTESGKVKVTYAIKNEVVFVTSDADLSNEIHRYDIPTESKLYQIYSDILPIGHLVWLILWMVLVTAFCVLMFMNVGEISIKSFLALSLTSISINFLSYFILILFAIGIEQLGLIIGSAFMGVIMWIVYKSFPHKSFRILFSKTGSVITMITLNLLPVLFVSLSVMLL